MSTVLSTTTALQALAHLGYWPFLLLLAASLTYAACGVWRAGWGVGRG